MGPGILVFGALAIVAAVSANGSKKPDALKATGVLKPTPIAAATAANKWSIVGCDPFHTPSGSNAPAMPGLQSHADYQWCYVVRDGDTPGDVAALILGPEQGWRYVELLTANPEKAIRGSVIAPDAGDKELNFQDWAVGEVVRLPRTWNPWIDQVGSPRGEAAPYMPPGYAPGYGAAA